MKTLGELQYGDGVKLGTYYDEKIRWLVADKNHSGHPDNSVDLVTKDIVKMASFDAIEPYSGIVICRTQGYARWRYSNIRQFLNSYAAAGRWFSASHVTDVGPASGFVDYDPYYSDHGFLYQWTEKERGMLISLTHRVPMHRDAGTVESVTDKVYLPTANEMGVGATLSNVFLNCGTIFQLFNDANSRIARLTAGAASHAETQAGFGWSWVPRKGNAHAYWTGSASYYVSSVGALVNANGAADEGLAYQSQGIRPAVCLSADTVISDTPDADGDYVVFIGTAPTAPQPVEIPEAINGDETINVSWGLPQNIESGFRHYVVERSIDGGDWEEVYVGTSRNAAVTVEFGTGTIQFRVCAINSFGVESPWAYSNTVEVWNNHLPVITASTDALGVFGNDAPVWPYTITDEDNDAQTVQEFIDGELFKTKNPALGVQQNFEFSNTEWLQVLNGTHILKIVSTDAKGESTSKSVTFSKNVDTIQFVKAFPVDTDEMPTEAMVFIDGEFPAGCDLTIEICNNGYDANPTWQDVTEDTLAEELFEFTNTRKTAANWGVLVRVTLSRGTATGDCYIEQVIGNFN